MDPMYQMVEVPSGWIMFGVVEMKVDSLIVELALLELMTVAIMKMLELAVLKVAIDYTELNS